MKRRITTFMSLMVVALFANLSTVQAQSGPETLQAARHDTSRPLSEMVREMPLAPPGMMAPYAIPNQFGKLSDPKGSFRGLNGADGLVQDIAGTSGAPVIHHSFDGTSDDDNAALLGFRVVPPDTEGDVGPNHYVQWNNLVAEIFDKSGTSLLGPFAGNAFFSGFGGLCESNNDGDPIVLYDHLADRWMVSQFGLNFGGNNYALCIAVSTTPDPTGAYHRYEFNRGIRFPDYFKVGVWDDAYYITARVFPNAGGYAGIDAMAVERNEMLNGNPADIVVFQVPGGSVQEGWLPADLDGPAPPAGTPGLFMGSRIYASSQNLEIYEMDVNWATPGSSTFTQVGNLATGPFTLPGSSFVPQQGTSQRLDSHGQFLMFRLAYRNFGTHQAMVSTRTVSAGGIASPHWWELRNTGSGWSIYQENTFAPADGIHRWMGAIAMNGSGDIALGYSTSNGTMFPSIHFTGQTADQSGTGIMNVTETLGHAGTGSQTGASRWGDYSAMSVDPSDDTSFWYTQEYYQTTGSFDFNTRILHFDLGSDAPPPQDLTVSVDPRNPPIVIDANGGTLVYRLRVQNAGTTTETVDYWTNVSGPGLDKDLRRISVTLAPGESFVKKARIRVPGSLAAGTFTVTGNIGAYPTVLDSDSFTFEKLPAAAKAQGQLVTDWAFELEEDAGAEVPSTLVLEQNYPNPFNPSTQIAFRLENAGEVSLKVFNLLGQEVASLVDGFRESGSYQVQFDASRLSAGVYVYMLTTGETSVVKHMTLLK